MGSDAAYRLNALAAFLPRDGTVAIGTCPYLDDEQLDTLRADLAGTHLVRRSGDRIETIGLAVDAEPDDEHEAVLLVDRIDIAQYLVREWLVRHLVKHGAKRAGGGTIQYISDRAPANLLLTCLPRGVVLPEGIGRRIAADFDVRRIRNTSGATRLVVCIDVRSRVTIDCPVSVLQGLGVDVRGAYVQRQVATRWGLRRRLAGRVVRIANEVLELEDRDEGVQELVASEAWLEPRRENLELIIRAATGTRAHEVLARLNSRLAERLGGKARPSLVDEWVAAIRRFSPEMAQGIKVSFDDAVMHADGGRFPPFELYKKPQLVFDVGGTKTDTWNQGGLDRHGPYNVERFSPKKLSIAIICQARRQGDVERFVQQLLDGVPGSRLAEKGFLRRYRLERPLLRTFTARSASADDYRRAISAAVDDATSRGDNWSLALVQTDESFHNLSGGANPYLLSKALLLQYGIPSQAFEWESVRPNANIDGTLNNIGLAAYAKVNGVPWLLPVHQSIARELIIGIGSFEEGSSRFGERERYIGVATAFSADGRYMLESRTPATPAAQYLPSLLEALERVVLAVRDHQAWSNDDPVRLVFHVFKDFNYTEIDAVRALMRRLSLPHAEFAFVHLVEDHPFMLFDPSEEGSGGQRPKGVAAAPRGLRVDISESETLLCLKGSREVKQWTDGIPKPMLLRLHRDSTFHDLGYLARQVFDFSCLSWRTLFPSPLPISVLYAGLVAKMLLQLRDVPEWRPETILGPIGRGRWFL